MYCCLLRRPLWREHRQLVLGAPVCGWHCGQASHHGCVLWVLGIEIDPGAWRTLRVAETLTSLAVLEPYYAILHPKARTLSTWNPSPSQSPMARLSWIHPPTLTPSLPPSVAPAATPPAPGSFPLGNRDDNYPCTATYQFLSQPDACARRIAPACCQHGGCGGDCALPTGLRDCRL